MRDLQKDIYRTFDQEGIKLKPITKFQVSADLEGDEQTINSYSSYSPFQPQRDQFNLTDQQFVEWAIQYIYDTTSVRIDFLEDLDKYPSINNLPFILKLNEYNDELIIFVLAFGTIPGSITIRKEDDIRSLGNIEIVEGTLGLSHTSISSLGKLRKVKGSFWISYLHQSSDLYDLNELEEVSGSLLLRGLAIRSLSKLKTVGGILNLRGTSIEDLGALNFVGEHLYLPKSKRDHFDFTNIYIGGKVKYFES